MVLFLLPREGKEGEVSSGEEINVDQLLSWYSLLIDRLMR